MLGLPESTFANLDQLLVSFEPYFKLWDSAGKFYQVLPEWKDGSLLRIDVASMKQSIDECATFMLLALAATCSKDARQKCSLVPRARMSWDCQHR
jgi:hypothetical protein